MNLLQNEPHLIHPNAATSFVEHLNRLYGSAPDRRASDESRLPVTVYRSVAVVELSGPLVFGWPDWVARYGFLRQEDIVEVLNSLAGNERVHTVVLVLNSPGGMATGTPETARRIRALSEAYGKRTVAWANPLAASGAYWLAASCDHVSVFPTGRVGSIGAVVALVDDSRWWDEKGLKLEAFTSDAEGKLRGYPGRRTTDEDRAHFQAGVDRWGERFRDHVTTRRPQVDGSTVFSGDTWDGEQSIALGLADSLAEDWEQLFLAAEVDPDSGA